MKKKEKKYLDIDSADIMDWDSIIKVGDIYRTDSIISALAANAGKKAAKYGWKSLNKQEKKCVFSRRNMSSLLYGWPGIFFRIC